MQKIVAKKFLQSFLWDISKGDSGAIGIYSVPIRIPKGVMFFSSSVEIISPIIGNGSQIELRDDTNTTLAQIVPNVLGLSQNTSMVNNNEWVRVALGQIHYRVFSTLPCSGLGMLLEISGVVPISSGAFIWHIEYIDSARR